jgi:hypothetical protein
MSQPSAADRAAQPLELDTQVTKAIGITLRTCLCFDHQRFPLWARNFSGLRASGSCVRMHRHCAGRRRSARLWPTGWTPTASTSASCESAHDGWHSYDHDVPGAGIRSSATADRPSWHFWARAARRAAAGAWLLHGRCGAGARCRHSGPWARPNTERSGRSRVAILERRASPYRRMP